MLRQFPGLAPRMPPGMPGMRGQMPGMGMMNGGAPGDPTLAALLGQSAGGGKPDAQAATDAGSDSGSDAGTDSDDEKK